MPRKSYCSVVPRNLHLYPLESPISLCDRPSWLSCAQPNVLSLSSLCVFRQDEWNFSCRSSPNLPRLDQSTRSAKQEAGPENTNVKIGVRHINYIYICAKKLYIIYI